MKAIRIGAGAGYSEDRIDPAVELAEKGQLSYLVFECLAERTIALAQLARRANPDRGYNPLLASRMEAVLPICKRNGVKIVTNMGAANPSAAAAKTAHLARELGLKGLKIAAVTGDDVLNVVSSGNFSLEESGLSLDTLRSRTISANAYLGAAPIIEALASGADVVLTGRTSDPALFVAPLVHELGWAMDDWDLIGQGTVIGHLLECAGQLTGGYFADPGYKEVPRLAELGFPLAEVSTDGSAIITKVEGSGGLVNVATCKEQLLYEIQDPAAYVTPDVIADFSDVCFHELEENRIRVSGGKGRPRPDLIKTSVGLLDGYSAEGQISYAGPGALARARLAQQILYSRLSKTDLAELRFDLIGVNSILGESYTSNGCDPPEVRLRVAGKARDVEGALALTREVESLYTNGPAGGGGITTSMKEIVTIESALIPRNLVKIKIDYDVC